MTTPKEVRVLEAIVCALVAREGGEVRLTADEIARHANLSLLWPGVEGREVVLTVLREAPTGRRRSPRRTRSGNAEDEACPRRRGRRPPPAPEEGGAWP